MKHELVEWLCIGLTLLEVPHRLEIRLIHNI